jgi:hypothetical protein
MRVAGLAQRGRLSSFDQTNPYITEILLMPLPNKVEAMEPAMTAQAFFHDRNGVRSWQGHQDVGC